MVMNFRKSIICLPGLISAVLISACSTNIPQQIKQPLDGSPQLTDVLHHTESYLSQKVRWGGIIASTENMNNTSELTVVALPIKDNGKPKDSDQSPGRFIAVIDHFVEPLVYSPDRKITVTGHIIRSEKQKVGEFSYDYPVIEVEDYYLWPAEPDRIYIDSSPYYWYDPYYPWRYPYYYPYW